MRGSCPPIYKIDLINTRSSQTITELYLQTYTLETYRLETYRLETSRLET